LRGRLSEAERSVRDLRNAVQTLERRIRDGTISPDAEPQITPDVTSPKPPDAAPLAERRPDPVTRVRPPPISPVSAQPTPRCPSPVADALAAFGPWLRQSWFYAVSALSLALAGIFLVQYGMENGLLPPRARVAAAPAFGAALIGIGEFIRRCFGDGQESVTAYLPSVFSGAGIVTLFGAILSARMLYDLIGGGPAMIGMVAIALLAMVLGWLHGPLLAAVGVIGAYGAPIFLSSSNTDGSPLFGYFAVVAVFGLGVDTIRRWGWVSALTLGLGYVTGWGLPASSGSRVDGAAILYFTVLPMLAIVIPAPNLMPDHGGCRADLCAKGQGGRAGLARVPDADGVRQRCRKRIPYLQLLARW